jgi:hypothetical protein
MQTTGRVAALLRAHPNASAVVDVIGIGAGVFDSLREQGLKPSAFNAAGKADGHDRSGELGFLNLRAEAWWRLREALDPAFGATLALPPDDQLIADLTTPKYTETSRGLIQIEAKDELRKRLGRSTDSADAVVMACFDAPTGQGAAFMEAWKAELEGRDLSLEVQSGCEDGCDMIATGGDCYKCSKCEKRIGRLPW